MEAAPTDVGGQHMWCVNPSTYLTGVETITVASASVIGSGKANTNAIIAFDYGRHCSQTSAWVARAYGTGTATAGSWFLPSLAELNQLYVQRAVVGGFTDGYWSSSQAGHSTAWYVGFGVSLNQGATNKSWDIRVRPVRAF